VRELVVASVPQIERACPQLCEGGGGCDSYAPTHGLELLGCGPGWAVCHGNALSGALATTQPPFEFAAIHVGAAAEALPDELLSLLVHGGRMVSKSASGCKSINAQSSSQIHSDTPPVTLPRVVPPRLSAPTRLCLLAHRCVLSGLTAAISRSWWWTRTGRVS
jgi:hypothetical protein